MIRVTVLGSGTSTGVPSVACECPTCRSTDPRDKRLRTSLLVRSDTTTVVIDTSLDFRQQMLQHDIMDIDGIVFTHHHFDHIGGFDDIRPYNFRYNRPIRIHAMQETVDVLHDTFPYAFGLIAPSGAAVPSVDTHIIDTEAFTIGDITLQPIPMRHGSMRVNGYRIGSLAYCTDTNSISRDSMDLLTGLSTLILDGLRYEPHPTHFTVAQALAVIDELEPERTYLTHISHQIMHTDCEARLPANVRLAYDGLTIDIPDLA